MLEYCWLFTLLLISARYFTGIEGKWTKLPPILPPTSKSLKSNLDETEDRISKLEDKEEKNTQKEQKKEKRLRKNEE